MSSLLSRYAESVFWMGRYFERAESAQIRQAGCSTCALRSRKTGVMLGRDFTFWTILLRAASAYHSYRRVFPQHIDPKDVARFLIFDARLASSLLFASVKCRP